MDNPHAAPRHSRALLWSEITLVLGMSLCVYARILEVRRTFGSYNGCITCLDSSVIVSDATMFAAASALLVVSGHFSSKPARLLLASPLLLLGLLVPADLFLQISLSQRLHLSDIEKFLQTGTIGLGDKTGFLPFFLESIGKETGKEAVLGAVLLLSGALSFSLSRAAPNRRPLTLKLLVCLAVLSFGLGAERRDYIIPESYMNLIETNLSRRFTVPYSTAYKNRLRAETHGEMACRPTDQGEKAERIIVVIVESLSRYHSQLLSGHAGVTPLLDKLAVQNAYFPDFFANGFTTEGGLIAILTGDTPTLLPKGVERFSHFSSQKDSPTNPLEILKRSGFSTQFFSAADLSFLGTGSWLSAIGFDQTEGPEHPFYENLPRGNFGDPGTEQLFKRYLQWYDEKSPRNTFSVIQTIGTHPPFLHPGVGQIGEQRVFEDTDNALFHFVQGLEKRGFFDRGILVVTGDHRTMSPLKDEELRELGKQALARIPAVVVGMGSKGVGAVPGRWQQTDIMPSLIYAATGVDCSSPLHGRFWPLSAPHTASYITHSQGVQRGTVMVWNQEKDAPNLLKLAGDDTRWEPALPAEEQVMDIVRIQINRQRALTWSERLAR